ncbi:MAG: hypothetical protein U0821_00910 [Chloroflexota bacterium]
MAAGHAHYLDTATGGMHNRLEAAGWGLFFIWLAIAFLLDIGWGAALLGVGVIILGVQVARMYLRLHIEWFWLVLGLFSTVWGLASTLGVRLSDVPWSDYVLPALFVALGARMLARAWRGSAQ